MFFDFQENYEQSKGEMRGSEINVGRDVEKSVKGYDKRNEYNCIEERTLSTTMCITTM